jgi:hypothetical protein
VIVKAKYSPIIVIVITVALMLSACSTGTVTPDRNQMNNQNAAIANSSDISIQSIADEITSGVNQFLPEDMVAFEGSVFVASTKPEGNHWVRAGWQIARKSLKFEVDQVPVDCTLYKHLGVEDQWIGSCSGYILIPRDGANHIAVMHTQPDGTSILVQVSPPPDSNGHVSSH